LDYATAEDLFTSMFEVGRSMFDVRICPHRVAAEAATPVVGVTAP
jgi:hypothetical protein